MRPGSGEDAGVAFSEGNFDGVGVEEGAEAHDEFGFAFGEVVEVGLEETFDHFALALADNGHVDVPFAVDDAELISAAEEVGDLGGVDDVFAGEAGNVGAGSA
jgi:hypothetical protein